MFAPLEPLLRAGEGRELRRLKKFAKKVNSLSAVYESMSDAELKSQTNILRSELEKGTANLDSVEFSARAFATVREAAHRVLGKKPYDVQVMGGYALHRGSVAEMRTGEGKTLVAVLPTYLNALAGRGVHVITTNDFLAQYQGELMGRVFSFLGLTTGIVVTGQKPLERKKQYLCDVTYGVNNEFGFDYLKDNMAMVAGDRVQRGHFFAVVDEVDSILIDEARTPLIISGPSEHGVSPWFEAFATLVKKLKPQTDYEVDVKKRTVAVTSKGIERVEDQLGIENLYAENNSHLLSFLDNALKAKALFKKDIDYVVSNGTVNIVDEHTGRVLDGRRYSEGLHQAIEAKEGVEIKSESQTYATVTLQNYFRLYEKLSGMTGTAETESAELWTTYKLRVTPIPTHRPVQRIDYPDEVYRLESAKFEAVIRDIKPRYAKGQPVLVGTASVSKSEYLSGLLEKNGIPHKVLNAKNHEHEAAIVARAGMKGAVTIATNMAGRGTDIMLGGNAEFLAREALENEGVSVDSPDFPALFKKKEAEVEKRIKSDADYIRSLGGLCVLATERHESRRIDNQLRGRAGRQGDPGESKFYLSLQDDLIVKSTNTTLAEKILSAGGYDDSVPLAGSIINNFVTKAQKSKESHNSETRKNVVKYDNVLSEQRKKVYEDRNRILDGTKLTDFVKESCRITVGSLVTHYTQSKTPEDYDINGLYVALCDIYPARITPEDLIDECGSMENLTRTFLEQTYVEDILLQYNERRKAMGIESSDLLESKVTLQALDSNWREHLYAMDYLKEGIGLRSMAQKDPFLEYSQEGYKMFKELMELVRRDVVTGVFSHTVVKTTDETATSSLFKEQFALREGVPGSFRSYSDSSNGTTQLYVSESKLPQVINEKPVKQRKKTRFSLRK